MSATPEGKVKKAVKAILAEFPVYGYWPVPGGYGAPTLDFIGCVNGRFFAIEAKAPGEKPTARQFATIRDMTASGAIVFVIDGKPEQLEHLRFFLARAVLDNGFETPEISESPYL